MTGTTAAGARTAEWHLIDTAPKDGTGILAKLPDSDMPHTVKFWHGVWVLAWDHSALVGWDAPTHWTPIPDFRAALAETGGAA